MKKKKAKRPWAQTEMQEIQFNHVKIITKVDCEHS